MFSFRLYLRLIKNTKILRNLKENVKFEGVKLTP